MLNEGRYKIIENDIAACDYEYVLSQIGKSIENKTKLLISPVASQTLVIAKQDTQVEKALESFDLLVPDSHWVMKSLNWIHKTHLKERVYGPDLMLKTCALAEKKNYSVFLYGTNIPTLKLLKNRLITLYPHLKIVGVEPSVYRELKDDDLAKLGSKINRSRANILFIALGSPLQEVAATQLKLLLKPLTVLTVGAAFDFISQVKKQAPIWMQQNGLEWLFRLWTEPSRLLWRYLRSGSFFAFHIVKRLFELKIKLIVSFVIIPMTLIVGFTSYYSSIYKQIPIRYWDEHDIAKTYFYDYFVRGDFNNVVWRSFQAIDQPKLASYIYGHVLSNKYKAEIARTDFVTFLASRGFYNISKGLSVTKYLPSPSWSKTDFDVDSRELIKKYGASFINTIQIINDCRKINVIILSINLGLVYFLYYFLTKNSILSVLGCLLYGTNYHIVRFSLIAQSDGLFIFIFNLCIIFILLRNKIGNKIGALLVGSTIALLNATKINGAMLFVPYALLLFYDFRLGNILFIDIIKKLATAGFLFCLVFIVLDPTLYARPISTTILMYKHRYNTAQHQAMYELPQTNMPSIGSRIYNFYNNFFGAEKYTYFKYFSHNETDNYKQVNSVFTFFLSMSTLLGVFYCFFKDIQIAILVLSITLSTITYQNLNWDRYYILHYLLLIACLLILVNRIKRTWESPQSNRSLSS